MTDITKTHNQPPIVLPTEDEMLAEMRRKYPEIAEKLEEWDKAFATYPEELTLEQEDIASSLQDLIAQVNKTRRGWIKSDAPAEKGPLNKLVKVVTNFFSKADEKVDTLLEVWEPRYQAYLDKKKAEATRKAEEEAERQREAQAEAQRQREAAEKAQREAEERAEAERRREAEEREKAEKAKKEREEAEARAAAAKEEERRLAAEKAQRDREEKERNNVGLREIRGHMREADKLHTLAEAEEATDEETARLDELVRPGGIIGTLAAPIAASPLLDDEQKAYTEELRGKLSTLREAINARFNKREQARREKERKAAEEAEAKLAAERKAAREKEEKELADARERTRLENEAAEKAKQERQEAEAKAREAREKAGEAGKEAKTHGKDAKAHGQEESRAANRADRVENNLEKATDADLSRTRGDLGSVGGLQKRWTYYIVDEAALRAGFIVPGHVAPSAGLAEHLTTSALEGAVFHWMRAHQGSWQTQRLERIENALPGVVFAHEQEIGIR